MTRRQILRAGKRNLSHQTLQLDFRLTGRLRRVLGLTGPTTDHRQTVRSRNLRSSLEFHSLQLSEGKPTDSRILELRFTDIGDCVNRSIVETQQRDFQRFGNIYILTKLLESQVTATIELENPKVLDGIFRRSGRSIAGTRNLRLPGNRNGNGLLDLGTRLRTDNGNGSRHTGNKQTYRNGSDSFALLGINRTDRVYGFEVFATGGEHRTDQADQQQFSKNFHNRFVFIILKYPLISLLTERRVPIGIQSPRIPRENRVDVGTQTRSPINHIPRTDFD